MITFRFLSFPNLKSLYIGIVSCVVFLLVLTVGAPADAASSCSAVGSHSCDRLFNGERSDGSTPVSIKNCTFGMC